jgi:hypothetical protein
LAKENLRSIAHQPAYDTSDVNYRQVAKDCLFSYHGNCYPYVAPFRQIHEKLCAVPVKY